MGKRLHPMKTVAVTVRSLGTLIDDYNRYQYICTDNIYIGTVPSWVNPVYNLIVPNRKLRLNQITIVRNHNSIQTFMLLHKTSHILQCMHSILFNQHNFHNLTNRGSRLIMAIKDNSDLVFDIMVWNRFISHRHFTDIVGWEERLKTIYRCLNLKALTLLFYRYFTVLLIYPLVDDSATLWTRR